MINKTDFAKIRKEMELSEHAREQIIRKSRDILKTSKSAIYSLHRKDTVKAKKQLDEAKKKIIEIRKVIKKELTLIYVGAFNEALEEYSEAQCYYGFTTKQKIPTIKELNVEPETYIAGLSDMTGELVRKAINSAIQGNYETSINIKKFIEQLYSELMLFEFKGLLRKKFDSIKYGLEKIEELVLQIKLKKLGEKKC